MRVGLYFANTQLKKILKIQSGEGFEPPNPFWVSHWLG